MCHTILRIFRASGSADVLPDLEVIAWEDFGTRANVQSPMVSYVNPTIGINYKAFQMFGWNLG